MIREIAQLGADIAGVSCDDVAARGLQGEVRFNFRLADIGGARGLRRVERRTSIRARPSSLASTGASRVFPKVKVDGHVAEVFQALGGALS